MTVKRTTMMMTVNSGMSLIRVQIVHVKFSARHTQCEQAEYQDLSSASHSLSVFSSVPDKRQKMYIEQKPLYCREVRIFWLEE